ncbi:diguanylate cyclase domain-containing protein [Nocardioides sp.]|uniref:GGDEF domain-containing protein n=1 Tax=Nocardioides sp. TaxID=35761 RepID=UPI0039E4D3E3
MALDTPTLRVAFAVVSLSVLVLAYAATYRSTRAPFGGWWCLSLVCFLTSAGLYLLNGTDAQVLANPVANAAAVAGAGFVWAAGRSLRGVALSRWQLLVGPAAALVAGLVDHPADNVWAGGGVLLAGMSLLIGLSASDLWRAWAVPASRLSADDGSRVAILAIALTSSFTAAFYALRLVAFLVAGPDHRLFTVFFGSGATTLILTVMLVTVTFSISTLAHAQVTIELREQAAHDNLTGLLNRAAFMTRAEIRMRETRHLDSDGVVVMIDLDDFKQLNDTLGHQAGDRALVDFGDACRAAIQPGDLAARLGGDEFVLLLPERPGRSPESVTATLDARLGARAEQRLRVSYGIAELSRRDGLEASLARADAALYRAKAVGGGVAVWHDEEQVS